MKKSELRKEIKNRKRQFTSQQLGDAYKIGICFDFQLVESIECEEHDIRMDEVISGK